MTKDLCAAYRDQLAKEELENKSLRQQLDSRDAEIAELKTNITFDWDRFKASQEALRENMKLMSEVMSDRRVLIEACETFMNHGVCEVSYYAIKEALAKVRKP